MATRPQEHAGVSAAAVAKMQEGQGAGAVSQMQKEGRSQRGLHPRGLNSSASLFSILVMLTIKEGHRHMTVARGGFSPSVWSNTTFKDVHPG